MFDITLTIIIVTCVITLTGFRNGKVVDELIFWPPAISKKHQYYRFITCGLIHADYMHLIFNMLTLYFFGTFMEAHYQGELGLQKWYYLALYIGALIVSNIPTYLKHRNDYNYRSLGASGAVSAVLVCIYPFISMATDSCTGFSGSCHCLWSVVSSLFSLHVQERWRQRKSRCTFLWSIVRHIIYDCCESECGR